MLERARQANLLYIYIEKIETKNTANIGADTGLHRKLIKSRLIKIVVICPAVTFFGARGASIGTLTNVQIRPYCFFPNDSLILG